MSQSGVRPGITRIREAADLATALGAGVDGYSLVYQHSTGNFVLSNVSGGGGGGTTDHALLSNLDYASAAHTGFAGTGVSNTFTQNQQFSQNITVTGDVIVGDDISVIDDIVAGGDVTAASIISPLLTSALNVDITVNPGGTGALVLDDSTVFRSATFDSSFPIGGFRIGPTALTGQFGLTIGDIKADTLKVVTFVADETRVERANQYWTKSYGQLAEGFTTPASVGGTVTVKFEDSPSLAGALASNNDWVLFRTVDVSTGLSIKQSWGQLTTYTDNGNGTQSWTFTLRSGDTNTQFLAGATGVIFGASGAAYIHLSVNDSAGAPYIKGRKWVTDPYTAGNHTTYWQLGTLGGTANPHYTPTGNGLYVRSGVSAAQFIVADDNGFQIRGVDFLMYNGSLQTVQIASGNGSLKLGTNIASGTTTGFHFDGSNGNITIGGASYSPTVTVYGAINIKAGSTGIANLTDAGALATGDTLDDVPNGSTYFRTTANQVTGAGRAFTAINSSNQLVTSVIPASAVTPSGAGLYLDVNKMGYYSGSEWKTYMDSSGNFRFQGSAANNYIQWAAASNKLQGVGSGTEQWYASAADGVLYAGAGNVWLDASGLNLEVQTFGSPDYIRFERSNSALATIGFQRATGGGPLTTDGMIFNNLDGTKFRFIGAATMEIAATVNITGGIGATGSGNFESIQVGRGLLTSAAAINGTTHASLFATSTTEHTYIRGGKAGSHVYINDTAGLGNVYVGDSGGAVYLAESGAGNVYMARGGGHAILTGTTATGKVGIGTASPSYKMDILVPSGAQNIFRFAQTGVSNGMTITSDGSVITYTLLDGPVGIGLSPTHRLHVQVPSGAQNILAVAQTGVSNGMTITSDGTNWTYTMLGGKVDIGGSSSSFSWRFNVLNGNGQMSFNPDFSGVNYLSSYISGAAGPLALFGSQVMVDGDTFRIMTSKTPASATATGTPGMIAWDTSYIYVCTATNTWRRIAHATW